MRKGGLKERVSIKNQIKLTILLVKEKLRFKNKLNKIQIRLAISILGIIVITIAIIQSNNSQKMIEQYSKEYTAQWKEHDSDTFVDMKNDSLLDSNNFFIYYGDNMEDYNATVFTLSRFKNKSLIESIKADETILGEIEKIYAKTANIKLQDQNDDFSIQTEQAKLDKMFTLYNKLSGTGKENFVSIKRTLDTTQKALDIISNYSKSYYIPVNPSHLVPTQFKFPLDVKVANKFRSKIAEELTWSPSSYNKFDKDDDIRTTEGWDNGPYGIFSWGDALKAYSVDMEGDSNLADTLTNSVNISSEATGWLKGALSSEKKEINDQNLNDMTKDELEQSIIDSLGSAFYERATQDDDKSITSIITPSDDKLWILQKNNKTLLKAKINTMETIPGTNENSAIFNLTDTITTKDFEITHTITGNGIYHIKGDTPIGKIDHTYTVKSKTSKQLSSLKGDTETFSQEEIAVTVYLNNYLNQYPNKNIDTAISDVLNQSEFRINKLNEGHFIINQSPILSSGVLASEVTFDTDSISSKDFNGNQLKYEKTYNIKELTKTYSGYLDKIKQVILYSDANTKSLESTQTSKFKTKKEPDSPVPEPKESDPNGDNTLQGYTGEDATNPFN
ncbi:hypothetical protein BFR38_09645 [Brochothrix thermosphacta]|uniref:hypothetical protein n=1 Tax=Brochothrix thermosphacta TaxID=2756 RepID=UPI00083F95CB|nr:hypothetical protein [Brochothrix thermosphacta]ODJ55092.1 hypothetical protein BFR38_09645 [Brochothrix thermosphacta]ODJ60903.1 hypothetical protein BFR42_10695 [Brochothrix thermosphacta]